MRSVRIVLVALLLVVPARLWSQGHHKTVVIEPPASYTPGQGAVPDLDKAAARCEGEMQAFRKAEGRPPLTTNPRLMQTAKQFADYMASTDHYGHEANGLRPQDRTRKEGYTHCIVLENIAYQYSSDGFTTEALADNFFQGWKKSPGHRKNMLDPDVTETGAAIGFSKKTGHYYAVQLFGRPFSDNLEFSIANETDEPIHYALGDRKFELPATYTRTHQECRPATLMLGTNQLMPKANTTYHVAKDADGTLQVKAAATETK